MTETIPHGPGPLAHLRNPRAALSDWELARYNESHSDFQLLLRTIGRVRRRSFLDIGCGTGEMYRYLRHRHPELTYTGYDVAPNAVERAKWKYPGARFQTCAPDVSDIAGADPPSGIVWCRDVVQYQPKPFEFLRRVMGIPSEATILRLRTRDKGATVTDPEASCQWVNGAWAPYLVFNTEELLSHLTRIPDVVSVTLVRHYEPLGGSGRRYLPKDCYDPDTGTARTSVLVLRSRGVRGTAEVRFEERAHEGVASPLWVRGARYVKRKMRS